MRTVILVTGIVLMGSCTSNKKYHDVAARYSSACSQNNKLKKENAELRKSVGHLKDSILTLNALLADNGIRVNYRPLAGNSKKEIKPVAAAPSKKAEVNKKAAALILSADAFHTTKEKEVLYYVNYARQKPQEFLTRFVLNKNYYDTKNYYVKTLIDTLRKLKPLPPLVASRDMFEAAKSHAVASGKKGYVGHDRGKDEIHPGYYAECCAYGQYDYENSALEIVLQLLVDEGVPSLGHRHILLGSWLHVGISIQDHKTYGNNCVLDLK